MPKCTVCTHLELQAIDQALLSGEFTLAALSQKFGPSASALQRHKGHLRDKMRESRRRLQEIQEQGSLLMLSAFLDHVKRGVEAAEAEGNLTGVFQGSYIGSRIIHQLGRMEASMRLDTLHRLLTSPAWVPQGSLLPTDPKLITDLHHALVENMSVFCPEPVPLISDDDADEDENWDESEDDEDAADDAEKAGGYDDADFFLDNSKLTSAFSETENGKRKTENGFLIRQLQELFPDLDLTLSDLPPRTEKLAKNQRKITEKSAPKTTRCVLKSLQNQDDMPSEKNLPKNHLAEPKTTAPPAVSAAEASSAIMAGDSAPAVPAMTNKSQIPYLTIDNDLSPHPYSLVPDPCFSDFCLLEADAPAASSGLAYDPYLPSPETANSEPPTIFYLQPAQDPVPDPPSALKTHVSATPKELSLRPLSRAVLH